MSDTKTLKQRKGGDRTSKGLGTNPEAQMANIIKTPPNYTNDDSVKIASKLLSTRLRKSDPDTGATFFIYHSLLIMFYFGVFLFRTYQYTYNKIKLRLMTLAYNPSKTPLLINEDINKLAKIPKRVSAILDLKPEEDENGGISGLLNDSSELISWCLCSGIFELSIYEKTGALKKTIPELRRAIHKKLGTYFGTDDIPNIIIKIPHLNLIYYGFEDEEEESFKDGTKKADIQVSLLSVIDGRSTIVDLTKIISELSLKKELKIDDINIQFVDDELKELVGPEPDLLILFQPSLDLQGYPPWHIRLSEIYWEQDNDQVDYSVFYRAFKKFSTCKVNVGK